MDKENSSNRNSLLEIQYSCLAVLVPPNSEKNQCKLQKINTIIVNNLIWGQVRNLQEGDLE